MLGSPQIVANPNPDVEFGPTLQWISPDKTKLAMTMWRMEIGVDEMTSIAIFDKMSNDEFPLTSGTSVSIGECAKFEFQNGRAWIRVSELLKILEGVEKEGEKFPSLPQLTINDELWGDYADFLMSR